MRLILALILAAGMASAQTTVNITNSLIGPVTQNFSNTQVNVSEAIITGAVVNASITNSFAPVNNITNEVSVGGATINNVVTNVIQTTITNDIDVAGVVVTNVTEAAVNIYNTTQVITSGVSSVNSATGAVTLTVQNTTNSAGVASYSGTVLSIGTNIAVAASTSTNAFQLLYTQEWAADANSYTFTFNPGINKYGIYISAIAYSGFGVKQATGGPFSLSWRINGQTSQYTIYDNYHLNSHHPTFREGTGFFTSTNESNFTIINFPRTNQLVNWFIGQHDGYMDAAGLQGSHTHSGYSASAPGSIQVSGGHWIDYVSSKNLALAAGAITQMQFFITGTNTITTGMVLRIYGDRK